MDPDSPQTQYPKRRFRGGTVLLASACLILGAAVTVSVMRSTSADPSAAASLAPTAPAELAALGRAHYDEGRFADAADAYRKAAAADPGKAANWSALGEAIVMASKAEPMPAEALASFVKALERDPKDARARYFMAVKRDLDGDHAGAIGDWLVLLAATPKGAPWEADLRRTIEQVGKVNRIDVAARLAAVSQPEVAPPPSGALAAIPGPSSEDLRAAAAIPPSEQRQMAEGMVARLEGKLRSNPGNLDGWVMLMRSRMTLDQPDKAAAALSDAIKANPRDEDKLRQQAAVLGLR